MIISAGSEVVWLNGLQLKRGQDRDYTIDYTSGELTFTPKHLIFFDSDIDIEYQYSESTYKSNYFETDINGSLNKDIIYNLTYINEKDNVNGSVLSKSFKLTCSPIISSFLKFRYSFSFIGQFKYAGSP